MIVRQADAHAWSEIWLANGGWTCVDPTAAIAPARTEYGIDGMQRLSEQSLPLTKIGDDAVRRVLEWGWVETALRNMQFAWGYANISWYYWVTDYRRERQARLLERLGITNGSRAVIAVILLQLDFYTPYFSDARDTHEGPTAFAARARASARSSRRYRDDHGFVRAPALRQTGGVARSRDVRAHGARVPYRYPLINRRARARARARPRLVC